MARALLRWKSNVGVECSDQWILILLLRSKSARRPHSESPQSKCISICGPGHAGAWRASRRCASSSNTWPCRSGKSPNCARQLLRRNRRKTARVKLGVNSGCRSCPPTCPAASVVLPIADRVDARKETSVGCQERGAQSSTRRTPSSAYPPPGS